MTREELAQALTELMQARIGWAKAEAYARDVTDWMRRKGLVVARESDPARITCANMSGTPDSDCPLTRQWPRHLPALLAGCTCPPNPLAQQCGFVHGDTERCFLCANMDAARPS